MEEIQTESQVISTWWTGKPYGDEGRGNMHII